MGDAIFKRRDIDCLLLLEVGLLYVDESLYLKICDLPFRRIFAVLRIFLWKFIQNGRRFLSFTKLGENAVEDSDGAFEILPVGAALRRCRNKRKVFLERLFRIIETASCGMDLSFQNQGLRIEGGVFANGIDGRVRLFAAACGVQKTRTFKADELLMLRIGGGHLLELHVRVVVELQFAELLDEFDIHLQIVR